MGFLEGLRDRFSGGNSESSVGNAVLIKELDGIPEIALRNLEYEETPEQKMYPAVNLSRSTIEITRVPTVAKARGEVIKACLVFRPSGGSVVTIGIENVQTGDELEPGRPLRFAVAKTDHDRVLDKGGTAVIYAKGDGEHKWKFTMDVPWNVKDQLMRQKDSTR